MVANRFKPTACQKVMYGNPKMVGINQFHNNHKGPPINNASNTASKNAADIVDNTFNTLLIGLLFNY